ncbi:Ig-like domain-containing protein [Flavobacterium cerinum]|uniref:T9SS type A sorting domain-containing protein n=1 Tax=Flavobacterium cerinum TaxID=2502784 RepID=A0A444H6H2_9FLAO|nr:T9SS type A sorting domain-containing protein [Flavobacterium cerinum]RWW98871.1 T9SS type A sorting domain-containing protein [Flavobacterium cerinum]
MKKITFLIAFLLSLITGAYAQTVLIDPAGGGGFANGATFAANGWTVANSANNPWYVGPVAASGVMTGNVAYISSAVNGATYTYSNSSPATNFFWRDVTVPAGETKITLSFNWGSQGETDWDMWQVFFAPVTVNPVASATHPGVASTNGVPAGIAGATYIGNGSPQTGVQSVTYSLPASLAGTTFRIIFSWKSDDSVGTPPPAAIDNISLVSRIPGNYISIASGNWDSPSTWNLNSVPDSGDASVTITAGHTVTVNAAGQSSPNTIVNGTLAYGTAPGSFIIGGNLTVASGGLVNVFNGTTGKTLTVGGNIINNGSIDVSVGTTTAGSLIFNGSAVQTLSGTGSFVNNTIRNLTFSNTSTVIPNINWQMNNLSVDYNLNISNAKINLGTNKFTYGTSLTSAGNTFTITNGGFMGTGKFARWWGNTTTGYVTSGPTSLPTAPEGRYPFYAADGQQRVFFLGRTTPTVGGIYAVSYNDATTVTTGLSIVDGAYTVTNRWNGNFVVTTEATSPVAASNWVTIFAPNAYVTAYGNSRILGQSAVVSGTHVNTSSVPSAQRSGVLTADVTAATGLYMGFDTEDTPYVSIVNGDWNNAATWNRGAVPLCTSTVVIAAGTNVTVNSAANVVKNMSILLDGTLTVASGDLTVGCTLKNNSFVNNGTLTVTGGTLNVNGSMQHNAGATFNQSGGDINVDGNDAGAAATSVASGVSIVQINTPLLNWTGGMLTIVDPHANSTASNSFTYTNSSTHVNITAGHTIRFGNGVSTDAGGNAANGFRVSTFPGSNRISFNNFVVNGGTGTNRYVTSTHAFGINGNMTINANSEYRDNGVAVNITGNLVNNGTYVATGTLSFSTFLNGTAGASTLAQTVTGTGIFVNAATAATANIASLSVNNSNPAGVTFAGASNIATQPANSVSVSGTLTFVSGKISTVGNASFILGVSTTTLGTLSYTAGGFASGVTFGRWFTATGTGSPIAAGTDASATTSRYPFVNSLNQDRSTFVERNTPVAAAGVLGVTYNNIAGTTAINVTDTSSTPNFVVDTKANDTWTVSAISGTPTAATSFELQLLAPGIFGGVTVTPTARIIQGASLVGTYQAGTITPGAQRVLTATELLAGPFSMATAAVDVPFASVANGDWNSPATWNKNAVPACTDLVNITSGTTVTVNTVGAVSKNTTIATGGTLTVASGDLTVGCTLKNNSLVNNGTLTVTGGTLTVNGNMLHNATAAFNQSGGDINVDGSDIGVPATSVASGTAIVQINTPLLNWTGGTLTIVDPHANATATNSFAYNSSTNVNITSGHTIRFGDGVSTDVGGNATNGFRINTFAGAGRISFNNLIVNGGIGTNRYVTTASTFGVNANMTVNANSEYRDNAVSTYVTGNLQNNGTYVGTGTLVFGTYLGGTAAASTLAQTVSGTGTFANSASTPTANLVSMTLNNTNVAGVTLNVPLSLSGTLTLTAGKLNTTTANLLTLGTAAAAGTLSGGSATAYVTGPIARTIANTNTSYILFPVGKAAYAPILLSPATTAVSVMKAEAFDTNAGTQDASIINLAANRRWEAPLVSGTMTALNVRLADAVFTNENIPVMAPAADGIYTGLFGSTSTFVAGTPNTIQSNTAVTAANYTGFISYAKSNLCAGTPVPGNTIASTNAICAGASVTLSVQNATLGSGVTYQWQSSPDNVTYTDIALATSATYVTTPLASLYYQLKVTCASGPATGTSTPVQITFSNNVLTSTPGVRCGAGTVSLAATGSAGTTVKWYTAVTGGSSIASGSPFVTPSINATTTYYAAAESTGGAPVPGGRITPDGTWGGSTFTDWGIVFSALQNVTLNSVDIYSTTDGTVTVKVTNAAGTELFSTGTINVTAGGTTTPTVVPLNFNVNAGTGYKILVKSYSGVSLVRGSTDLAFPYTNSNISVTSSEWGGTTTGTYYYFYNLKTSAGCSSARVPVVATVNTPPAITLSAAPAAVCSGQTTTAVTIVTGASDYDTYVWTPSTGVSGNSTTGWTFNPAASTVYSLQASSTTGTMCVAIPVTVNIAINPLPSAIVTAPTVAVCEGTAQALVATGGLNPTPVGQETFDVLSTQFTTASVTGTASAALNTTYFSQGTGSVLFTPTGNSSDVSYSSNANIDLTTYGGAQLTFSHIAAIEGSATSWDLGYVQYSSDGGTTWVTFPASSYAGSGTLITTQGTTNPVDGVIFSTKSYPDWITQFTGATSLPNSTSLWKTETINIPAAALTNQFRVRFRYTAEVSTLYYGWLIDNLKITGLKSNLVWSPVTNLYTDAAATVPYTGQSLGTVFVKPTAAASYTVTSSSPAGCSVTAPVAVTINVVAAPTVPAPTQDICNGGTVANLVATGTGIKWYAASTGGTALVATTALVNGTIYYASQTVGGCESAGRVARTVNITVVNAPTVPAPIQEFCNSGTVANLIATGTGIKWYAAATGGTALLPTVALVDDAVYYASQTVGTCESATRIALTANINLAPTPTVPAPMQQFCSASTIADLIATGTGIKWYTAATGGTALLATTALVDDTTYYAESTAGTCVSPARTALIVNITLVNAPTVAAPTQNFCSAATVADLTATGTAIKWYAAATGGTALATTTQLVNGTTYYASQTIDTCESTARTALTANVSIVPAPTVPALVQQICNSGAVGELITDSGINIKWYAAATGGTALESSASLIDDTIYYASQTIGTCESAARTALTVNINVIPAPTGNATQAFCSASTVGNLTVTGNAIVWYDEAIGGNIVAVTTPIVSGTTYYASQNIDGCEGITRLAVQGMITPAIVDDLADVSECSQYTLPVLTNGSYFTGPNGTGTPLNAGGVITQTTTLYVFTSVGTNPVCTAESSFVVTIANVPAPQGAATQTISVTTPGEATIADIVVTLDAGGTITWYATEEDASNGTNPLPATTELVDGEDYFATQTIGTCTSILTLKVTIDVVLGRDTFNKDIFTYYPNPVKDILNLSYTSDMTSIAVFNLLGQQVISQQPNAGEVKIDMSSLADGAYIVNVTSGSTIKTIKVIKKQ